MNAINTAVTGIKVDHNHDGSTYDIRVVQYSGPGFPCATTAEHLPEAVRQALLRWLFDATPEAATRIADVLTSLGVKA